MNLVLYGDHNRDMAELYHELCTLLSVPQAHLTSTLAALGIRIVVRVIKSPSGIFDIHVEEYEYSNRFAVSSAVRMDIAFFRAIVRSTTS